MTGTKVAVIGGGALGLLALKNLNEDGFDVTCYEARSYIGGLWRSSNDSSLSITQGTTTFNTSKFRGAISDFPFPPEVDDFPTAEQIHAYLESYCDNFRLRNKIELNTRVVGLRRSSTKWVVETLKNEAGSHLNVKYFDKVLVATGTFTSPKTPHIEGMDLFCGPNVHAMRFHDPEQYKGKTVLVVGLHATGQDVTVALSRYASKVYISHKRGLVMLPRYSASGATSDQGSSVSSLVFQTRIGACLPDLLDRLTDKRLEATSKRVFPVPSEWSFFPAPSNAVTGPLLADEIYALFKSGFAEPVPAAKRVLGSKSVEMVDGRVLTDIDAIIFCTGYETGVPVPLPTEHNPYPVAGQPPHLYRNTFPIHPDPDIRNSLAFLGHAIIPFPGFVLYELNAMCISQVWVGNSFLPSFSEMETWHQQRLRWREKLLAKQKMKGTTFYATMLPPVDHIKWLDDAAGTGLFKHFGWFSRCSWSFWCNEYELYMKCKYGLFTPVIWRLFNMGKRTVWEKATTQIWEDNELAKQRAKHKKILLERAQ